MPYLGRCIYLIIALIFVGLPSASTLVTNRALRQLTTLCDGSSLLILNQGREEFEQRKREKQLLAVNIGNTLDTLRADIPNSLHEPPDLSVFKANVRLSDPSGLKLQGIRAYDNALRILRALSAIAFCNSSEVSARFFFDEPRMMLRAKLNAQIQMKTGGNPKHACVVSYYYLCEKTGKVQHHVVDRVDLDGTEVDPFHLLADRPVLSENWQGAPVVPNSRDFSRKTRPSRSLSSHNKDSSLRSAARSSRVCYNRREELSEV